MKNGQKSSRLKAMDQPDHVIDMVIVLSGNFFFFANFFFLDLINFKLDIFFLQGQNFTDKIITISIIYTLKKSLSIVKLRSFQNASIEIKHIPFVYQQNLFPVTKLICEMQKENIFSNERFFFTLKRNPLIM